MIDEISDWEIAYPQRTFWYLNVPTSSDRADVWKTFVTETLGLPIAQARTDSLAKHAVKKWCLDYDMHAH